MLYKPTSASPHADVVDVNDKNGILFSCETLSNSKIDKARLMINDGEYEYYFDNDTLNSNIDYNNYGIDITGLLKNNTNANYKIKISNSLRNLSETSLSLSQGRNYTWQMRLYEEITSTFVPTTWIAWGVINSTVSVYVDSSGNYYSKSSNLRTEKKLLKISPHTNICFDESASYSYANLWIRYDENAKYYIRIGGKFYLIEDYKFYNPLESKDKDKGFDSYGNPLWGYAIVDKNVSVSKNDEYTILCNYIDTDIYYFDTHTSPEITLYEYFQNNENPKKRIIDSDNLILNYSNVNIYGEYSQAEGTSINYYSFLLEEKITDNEYEVVDFTNNIFSPFVQWNYDRFMNNTEYRLTLSLTDTTGVTMEKIINISVEYDEVKYPLSLKCEPYRKHNSFIIDFSELKSISAKENVTNGHQFVSFNEITGELDTNLLYGYNACHLDIDNSLIYNYIDGDGNLSFKENTYYLLIRIDSNYKGIIASVTSDSNNANDDNVSTISWNGVKFIIAVNDTIFEFSPYQSWYNENITDDQKIESINQAMKEPDINYSVPFLYYDNLSYDDTKVYYHEETVVSGQTWLIIVDTDKLAVAFKNMSVDDSEWAEMEKR